MLTYYDWSFWTVVVSVLAIIFSQIPPIHILLKKAKLDIELHDKISLTHKVGNTNLQSHIIVNNIGGRNIRVKNISITLERDGSMIETLPAQSYLQNPSDKDPILFTPFSLKPSEERAHIINFLNDFNRDDDKEYRTLESKMITNFRSKENNSDSQSSNPIELDDDLVQPFHSFFQKHFTLYPGEYVITLKVTTNTPKANLIKKFRFTIFESDTDQLKEITEHFKFGGGIWWLPNILNSIKVRIQDF